MTKNRYYIKTFGCQMNISDSERIAGFLESHKFKLAKDITEADLIVFNTCGVRQSAEDRVYGQIHNTKLKVQNSKRKVFIVLTGCLANRKDVQRILKDKVDLFFPINDFRKFENWIIKNYLEIVNWKLEIPARQNKVTCSDYLSITPKYTSPYQAYVPIMTGCDNFCSYCVVPYARGREVSRPANEIIKEIKVLVKKGYKEIFLLGQNVNSYKSEISKFKTTNFSDLLKIINAIPGKFWIRFLTSHPKDMSDELIETITQCKKVCEHVHLPVQAGDDEILRRMNRKYTTKYYLGLIKKIKKAFAKYKPDLIYSITTDIIVGFPGETQKQFLKSAEIMKKVKYDMVYFGQYSPRPGTASWKIKDDVSFKEKERREKYLNEILKETAFENNENYVGKTLEILVTHCKTLNNTKNLSRERLPKKKEGFTEYLGRTRTMKNVKVHTVESLQDKDAIGLFNRVKITKANIWNLEGKLATKL